MARIVGEIGHMHDVFVRAVNSFAGLRVLVIGDVMWDHYVIGNAERISPEAPVPVVKVSSERGNLGGAGNVAANLRALGARVDLVGVIGADQRGGSVRAELQRLGIDDRGLVVDSTRPTTLKLRILARNQQVVRVDWESRGVLVGELGGAVLQHIATLLPAAHAVVISDYAKGVVTRELVAEVAKGLPPAAVALVDPKGEDYAKYDGVTVLTPNQKEAELVTGINIKTADDLTLAGQRLLRALPSLQAVYITRGEQGIWVAPRDARPCNVPAAGREVYDVTGAGDTVISVLALGLVAGLDWGEAAVLANLAAGLVIRRLGCAVVTRDELLDILESEEARFYCLEAGGLRA